MASISISIRHGSAVIRHIVAISELTDLEAVRGLTRFSHADGSEGSKGGRGQKAPPYSLYRAELP